MAYGQQFSRAAAVFVVVFIGFTVSGGEISLLHGHVAQSKYHISSYGCTTVIKCYQQVYLFEWSTYFSCKSTSHAVTVWPLHIFSF